MKTLTTLTAIAALIAGISIASAQNQTNMPKASGSQSSGTMGQGSSTMNKQTATGNGQFCIEISKGGGLNCKFASMAACEKEANVQNLKCSPNPKSGTTGAK